MEEDSSDVGKELEMEVESVRSCWIQATTGIPPWLSRVTLASQHAEY